MKMEQQNTEKWYVWLVTSTYKQRYVVAVDQQQAREFAAAMWMERPENITAKRRSHELPPKEGRGATLASERLIRLYGDLASVSHDEK